MQSTQTETALLLVCPDAEYAVATARARFDRAAQDGIPAHITVIYPFKALELMTAGDHRRLEELAAKFETFSVRANQSGWFGDRVVYLAPDEPEPITRLTRDVWAAFPDFPPYAGKFADTVPHLTVGHDHSVPELQAAERSVKLRLPFTQRVDRLERWAGPAVEGRTQPSRWRHVRNYEFGSPP